VIISTERNFSFSLEKQNAELITRRSIDSATDQATRVDGISDVPIIADPYQESRTKIDLARKPTMSKIEFPFLPFPLLFASKEFLDQPKLMKFLIWAFARCSNETKRVPMKNARFIQLEPFEFIFGRKSCSIDTGLSEQTLRTIINHLINHQIILNITTKSTTKYTVYKWLTENFGVLSNHQNNRKSTTKQPEVNHNLDIDIDSDKDIVSPKVASTDKISKRSRKRTKTEPLPLIDRDVRVKTTQAEHEALLAKVGGDEELLKQAYDRISKWKLREGIEGGNDYSSALNWGLRSNKTEVKVSAGNSISDLLPHLKGKYSYRIEFKMLKIISTLGHPAGEFHETDVNGFRAWLIDRGLLKQEK